jgi:hypothetical protein
MVNYWTQQCGWLEDRFGVSWQIVPVALGEMMQEKDAENTERVMKGHWRGRAGWGARIRTWEWRNQNPLPYHLATPQQMHIFAWRKAADHSG